jgi:AcrR family transcriptional regulator
MASPGRKSRVPRREPPGRHGLGVARTTQPASQRERLMDAIVELAGQQGYQSLSIAQISAHAGVSSATFYALFEDREECLLAAYRDATGRTLQRMQSSLQGGEWPAAVRPAFAELLNTVQANPDAGRVMFVEALAGGPEVRAAVREVLDGLERNAELLLADAPGDGMTLDIPARALLGAVRHVVARHLRTHNEDRLPRLTDDVLAAMACYAVPAGVGRWSTGPEALLGATPALSVGLSSPELERLPRGRHGLPPGAVFRSQRARILQATAAVTMERGYANATVAQIVAAAGVAKEAFYRHFSDKEEAFLAAQEAPSQQILDALVREYFSAETWPERVWRALRTLLGLVAANPVMSHLRLVECYSAGAAAAQRGEEVTRSFTIFLEEGFHQGEEATRVPRLVPQAVAGGIFEIVQRDVADGLAGELPRRLPQLAYVATAPFLGPAAAIERVRVLAANEPLRGAGDPGSERRAGGETDFARAV